MFDFVFVLKTLCSIICWTITIWGGIELVRMFIDIIRDLFKDL